MRQRDETKAQDILLATLDEVKAVGLAGLSIEAVARRAGVATGTVYIYFKGKEALLNALYLHTKARFASFILPGEGLPVRAAFSKLSKGYMDYVAENEAELIFMGQMANSPYVTPETRATAALEARSIRQVLEQGKAEGLFKDMPTDWMMAFLGGAMRDMAPLARALKPADRAAAQEQIVTLCWDALKA